MALVPKRLTLERHGRADERHLLASGKRRPIGISHSLKPPGSVMVGRPVRSKAAVQRCSFRMRSICKRGQFQIVQILRKQYPCFLMRLGSN
jgi:hypothetical protein